MRCFFQVQKVRPHRGGYISVLLKVSRECSRDLALISTIVLPNYCVLCKRCVRLYPLVLSCGGENHAGGCVNFRREFSHSPSLRRAGGSAFAYFRWYRRLVTEFFPNVGWHMPRISSSSPIIIAKYR